MQFTRADLFEWNVAESVGLEHLAARLDEQGRPRPGSQPLRVKLGIDPTSPHLHIGHAVALWRLRAFQELGHTAVLIFGTFTAQVGDTSDRDSERPELTREQVMENVATYQQQAERILKPGYELHFNDAWLSKLSLDDFWWRVSCFPLNAFIKRELIAKRLEEGQRVGLQETLYPILQGLDSLEIGADVELGGSDQWFNLLAGRTLAVAQGDEPQAVITHHLLPGTDGRKMSKSLENGVYLDDIPADVFGKTMRVRDEVVSQWLSFFPTPALPFTSEDYESALHLGQNPMPWKRKMAQALTSLLWGEAAGVEAMQAFERQFQERDLSEVPQVPVPAGDLLEQLVALGLAPSRSEAKRHLVAGAVRRNDEKLTDLGQQLGVGDTVRVGRHAFRLV